MKIRNTVLLLSFFFLKHLNRIFEGTNNALNKCRGRFKVMLRYRLTRDMINDVQ